MRKKGPKDTKHEDTKHEDTKHDERRAAEPAPAGNGPPTEEEIRLCAYLKWEAAGKPTGGDITFWAEAERELRAAR